MEKNQQLRILTLICIIILGGLIAIQYYLIRNTYDLQKDEYVTEVRKSVDIILDSPEFDFLEDSIQVIIRRLELEKIKGNIDENQFKTLLKKKTDSICELGNRLLQQQEKDYPILKELEIRNQFYEIIFKNDTITDTILSASQNPIIFFGRTLSSSSVFNINTGAFINKSDWKSDDDEKAKVEKYMITYRHTVDMDISNWQQKVLKQMGWMLFFAVLLILLVVGLFFWMYRALIKQKKIAAIKTDFANNITHELKTPLTSLNLIVKSLENPEVIQNPEAIKQLTQSMHRQNNRIQHIFDRILETTVDQHKINWEEIDVVQFLHEFLSDYKSPSHQIKSDIKPSEFFLKTDSFQLGRVLQNILQNAEKYSPDSQEILVRGFQDSQNYVVEIEDFGKGIHPKELTKIFEKFYRISEGNIHTAKGLGLGLYLSKQIIESLNGSISVESQLNKGSIFTVKLPLK